VKYQHFLWMIGDNDLRTTGFHYSDTIRQYGLYDLPAANLTYTIGTSKPEKDWYFAQTKTGTWNISFYNPQLISGNAVLTASIAGAATTPSVDIYINGTKKTTWSFTNDGSIYRSAVLSGRHSVKTYTFPASLLKTGTNTIGLKMTSVGSRGGVMYDCIKLEAGGLYTGIESVQLSGAVQSGVFPNPFSQAAVIQLEIPESGNVDINIYDVSGRKIESIYNGFLIQGKHNFEWKPLNLPSGIYRYRIVTSDKSFGGWMVYSK
jgi:rhamnogalacturonan endolyase